jgi:NADPH-dependent curcumin reductase CurA
VVPIISIFPAAQLTSTAHDAPELPVTASPNSWKPTPSGSLTASGSSSKAAGLAIAAPKIQDTVTISAAAEANTLYRQGLSVAQIAALLGQSSAAIASYVSPAAVTTSLTSASALDALQLDPAPLSKIA